MRICRHVGLLAGAAVVAAACNGQGPTRLIEPSRNTSSAHPPSPSSGSTFDVTGVVTDEQGVPLPGAVVTMSHWLEGIVRRPTTITDASGRYRIGFVASPLAHPAGRFVARAEIAAAGHEEYWRSLFTMADSSFIENFRLHRLMRISAGDSLVVSVPPDIGECIGWVAEVCGIVHVSIPRTGRMAIAVVPSDANAATPPLEVCCVSGSEQYGNPQAIPVVAGMEVAVKIGMPRGFATTQSFVVNTSFDPS